MNFHPRAGCSIFEFVHGLLRLSVASLCRCPSSVVRVWCQSDFREISCFLPKLGYSFHFAAMDDTWTDMPALQSTRETQAQAVLDRDSRLRSVPQLVAMNPFPSFKFCASGVADHTWISAGASSLNDVPGAPQQYAADNSGSFHPVRDASNHEQWLFHGMDVYPPPPLQPCGMPASPVLAPGASGGGPLNTDFPSRAFPGVAMVSRILQANA